MAEQLSHLLRMSERRYLTLRVVPTSLGAHAAMTGAFRLLEFAGSKGFVRWEGVKVWVLLDRGADRRTVVGNHPIEMASEQPGPG